MTAMEMGEYVVGAWLQEIGGCDFVDYNVRSPVGGLAGIRYWLTLFGILLTVQASAAEWPEGAKWAYIERCAESLHSQRMPRETAGRYCACMTNGMSREFGLEEYDAMMRAQPNPRGSAVDLRLYTVFKSCAHILPR